MKFHNKKIPKRKYIITKYKEVKRCSECKKILRWYNKSLLCAHHLKEKSNKIKNDKRKTRNKVRR